MAVFPDLSAGTQADSRKYGPAVIICLGRSGEIALRQWNDELAQDPAGPQTGLHAILISRQPIQRLSQECFQLKYLQLEPPTHTSISLSRDLPRGLRADSCMRFRQVVNYQQFTNWLGDRLRDLQTEIRVFIVGSLFEPEIGIIGDVLQLLRILPESPGRSSPYAGITALLSLIPATQERLPEQDAFAALREIGRMSYPGPHIGEFSFGLATRRVDSALLDHLFLIENYFSIHTQKIESTAFEFGLGQALAEALFLLTHPTSRPLWQDLADELHQDAAQLRSTTQQVFVHSFGAATLYVPLTDIHAYIAARLAHAAIFGERTDAPEGLFRQSNPSSNVKDDGRLLGRRWLLEGSYQHPVFPWLVHNSPASLENLPDLDREFSYLFKAQVCHGLVNFLNHPDGSDLQLASEALSSLKEHIDKVEVWLRAARVPDPLSRERLSLQALLNSWRATLTSLLQSIAAWQQALQPGRESASGTPGSITDWRLLLQSSTGTPDNLQPPEKRTSLWEYLQQARASAESNLKERAKNRMFRPVTAMRNNDLAEIERYYKDTIRPELSRYIKESHTNYTRVRERLEWWINLTLDRQPELILICWPVHLSVTPMSEPPAEACFTPQSVHQLGKALMELSHAQIKNRAGDLTGIWFEERIGETIDFLLRARDAYLQYDLDRAARMRNAASRRSYLIANSPTFSQQYLNHVFQNHSRTESKALADGEKTRLSALTFRLNIPIDAIPGIEHMLAEYRTKSFQPLHIYKQEANAVTYEKRLWELERERIMLPSACTLTLYDQQLVTTFFQALASGLISIHYDKNRQNWEWAISAPGNSFTTLKLGSESLVAAFKSFALEIPYDAQINEKPTNPFHPRNANEYKAVLREAIEAVRKQDDYAKIREKNLKTIKTHLKNVGNDALEKAFLHLLQVEIDQPVWKNW